MQIRIRLTSCVLLVAFQLFYASGKSQDDFLLSVATEELNRQFDVFKSAEIPAYYMDFRIDEVRHFQIAADLGVLTAKDRTSYRFATARVRVGDYQFDNTFEPDDANPYGSGRVEVPSAPLPVENNEKALKQYLWRLGDDAYSMASEVYEELESADVDTTDETPPSFSRENPIVHYDPLVDFDQEVDFDQWTGRVKEISAAFATHKELLYGSCSFTAFHERSSFVSSEGASIAENKPYTYIYLYAALQGEEGNVITLGRSYFAFMPDGIPAQKEILADVEALVTDLKALAEAPLASPYTGPALLSPKVAGVFFHEIFGHRIEGHRLRSELDGQTFKERINEKVLPEAISVISNPELKKAGNQDLNGHYEYDNEGVRGKRVVIVDNGILKSFLMSRAPLDSLIESNGHGRAQSGLAPVSRQSNLLVESTKQFSEDDLRQQLIDECKRQEREYGYYFKEVTGGFTETSRYSTNAFNIQPTMVYRIYVDGRPDELVRGVDLIGTPLAMFAEIAATSDESDTFIGFCGAESGSVPVSATAPGLLVRRIETQKKPADHEFKEPLIPAPATMQR